MKDDIFVDGIMEVGFVGGAVRLHLGAFRPTNYDPKADRLKHVEQGGGVK